MPGSTSKIVSAPDCVQESSHYCEAHFILRQPCYRNIVAIDGHMAKNMITIDFACTRLLVETHGGQLRSSPGTLHGSVFKFVLPNSASHK
jgi:hypothetical protein